MSNMQIAVEFVAGTNLKDALKDAKEKAIALNVGYITFSFNGVNFSIGQTADIYMAYEEFISDTSNKYGIVYS